MVRPFCFLEFCGFGVGQSFSCPCLVVDHEATTRNIRSIVSLLNSVDLSTESGVLYGAIQ